VNNGVGFFALAGIKDPETLSFLCHQAARVAWLTTTQWVKYGFIQFNPIVIDADYYSFN
jgi:hypothetical protein